MKKKRINFLFIICLLNFFIFFFVINKKNLSGVYDEDRGRPLSQEEQREKALGIDRKERDSEYVLKEKFLRDIELNNMENFKLFLRNNGNDADFIVNNKNPLTHAAAINNFEIVKYLLNETEIDIDTADGLGNTALILASEKGLLEVVNFLINKGANVNYQNKQGVTPAMKAAEGNNFFVVKLLLEKNVDLTISDFTGRTLREISENSRDKRILKLLNENS